MHQKESHALSYLSAEFEPADWYRFVQLDPFAKKWTKLKLNDDDLRTLEIVIMATADRAPVVKGTSGLRKIRFSPPDSNRSKRDSFRVCYALFPEYGVSLLITVFGKNEQSDLSDNDKIAIAKIINAIQEQLDRGIIR